VAYDFAGGTGEANDPYQIATAGQLIAVGSGPDLQDKHYVLLNDIDLDPSLPDSRVFTRAVIASLIIAPDGEIQHLKFKGRFDGSGFAVYNLTISGEGFLGLFGILEKDALVIDLGLVQANITGTGSSIGGLAGRNYGTVIHCDCTGAVTGLGQVGGLVGDNQGTVTDDCYSDATVFGRSWIGGLVGLNRKRGIITNGCYSSGAVFGQTDVGGLVGQNSYDCRVTGCHSTGPVSGVDPDPASHLSGAVFGGLVGDNDGTVAYCYSHSTTSDAPIAGGLVGQNGTNGSVSNCYSTGNVFAETTAGGLVGHNDMIGSVSNCYSTGNVFGKTSAGGLAGRNSGNVKYSYSVGRVSGRGITGGLAGFHDSGWSASERNCFWDINTSGLTKSAAGTGLTSSQMLDIQTFLQAGWDFVGEDRNGLNEIWQMPVEGGYPILSQEQTKLSGRGTYDDPYLISTALGLGAINRHPTASFKLMANLDLSNIRYLTAVVSKFSGRFNGNGFVISNITIDGSDEFGFRPEAIENDLGLFGELEEGAEVQGLGVVDVNITNSGADGSVSGGIVGYNRRGRVFNCFSTGKLNGRNNMGGIVGENDEGSVSDCYSSATVTGMQHIGGIVGLNWLADVSHCYSAGAIRGGYVGGIVGSNQGGVTQCYSTSVVSGDAQRAGGLIGRRVTSFSARTEARIKEKLVVTSSFWDIESSGQTGSLGGVGLPTELMQDSSTYLEAGWDITYHPVNSPDSPWWMPKHGTPRLRWQYGTAYSPSPVNTATSVSRDAILQWSSGGPDLRHDVYFGEDEELVAKATPESQGIYCGARPVGNETYDPGVLQWGKTYYWRIDGINEIDPNGPWQGEVWSFTTMDAVPVFTVDDFESYDDHCSRIFFTWQGGWGHSGGENIEACNAPPYDGNGSSALVGNTDPPFAEQVVVHEGAQSLPIDYDNENWPWFSEAQRVWSTPQNWTDDDGDALVLYFRGEAGNTQDGLYVAIEDSHGGIAVLLHPDAQAVRATEWQEWRVSLVDLDTVGVDVTVVRQMVIGVGDRGNPQSGGTGRIYIDDIQLLKHMSDHENSEL